MTRYHVFRQGDGDWFAYDRELDLGRIYGTWDEAMQYVACRVLNERIAATTQTNTVRMSRRRGPA